MGTSPEELSGEIEQSREELGKTLDAIEEKVAGVRERARPANLARTKAAKVAGGALLGLLTLRWFGRRRRGRRERNRDDD